MQVSKDFLPLNGTDYVELYVGNAKQAAYFYRAGFGMRLVAYRGPETGTRGEASWVVEQGKIRFVLTTALQPDHPVAGHVRRRLRRGGLATRLRRLLCSKPYG